MHSKAVPRSNVFTLEDGTWVVQRGIDQVQELLSGKIRRFSSMDTSYEITDTELDILMAQGIITQYDNFFVWLSPELIDQTLTEEDFGKATYYSLSTDLNELDLPSVLQYLNSAGLSDRYSVVLRQNTIMILSAYEEPFLRLSSAENAQTLLSPYFQSLGASTTIDVYQFEAAHLAGLQPEGLANQPNQGLIRRLLPNITQKTIVCVDQDPRTQDIFTQVCQELGVDLVSASTGKLGLTYIQDADPTLVVTELSLPDIHGYEIIAAVRNNPDLVHIPIMIISSLDTETDRAFAYTISGVIDYISKPIQTADIRRRVWRELNRQN